MDYELANPYDLVLGNPEGSKVILEFGDYRCPYCHQAHAAVEELIESDPEVKVIYRQYPILGSRSIYAAKVVIAVGEQDKKKALALHNLLFSRSTSLREGVVLKLAREAGADTELLKRRLLDKEELEQMLLANHEQAEIAGVRATPGFVIRGRVINGYVPAKELENALKTP